MSISNYTINEEDAGVEMPNLSLRNHSMSARKGQGLFDEEGQMVIRDELQQQRRVVRPRGYTFVEQAQEVRESSLERE